MNVRLVHQLPPGEDNPRNSEGAFLRGKQGELLFAYSKYHGTSRHDHGDCDIALIVSYDEGETWTDPRLIARASEFGVENIMSVSAMEQRNGDLAFYFLIKENNMAVTLGRTVSRDGMQFRSERCDCRFPERYYVVNNDRLVRLSGGRIVAPAAYNTLEQVHADGCFAYVTTMLYSDDDGKTFYKADQELHTVPDRLNRLTGYQEPGIIELSDGSIYCWIRTRYGYQYECTSPDGDLNRFTQPSASFFSSPTSPMQIKKYDGVLYSIYNPIPKYNGRPEHPGVWGRTPIVIRKSLDEGESFGVLNTVEDDPTRGYSYPAMFRTKDGCLLLAYCRGDANDGDNLCRIGITKVEISSIE